MAWSSVPHLFFLFMFLSNKLDSLQFSYAIDVLGMTGQILQEQTLTSRNQLFELGFFTPGKSDKQYVGIWYKNISVRKVVWVANREAPVIVAGSSAKLELASDGNLRLVDGEQNTVWSTNITTRSNNSEAVLLDTGNFVLRDNISGAVFWQGFDFPCDTFLPSMMIGWNTKTGERRFLSSWKSEDDPSLGRYSTGVTTDYSPQAYVWLESRPYWRSAQWNGQKFIGIPDMDAMYTNGFSLIRDTQQGIQYITFNNYNRSVISIMVLTSTGLLQLTNWIEPEKEWSVVWVAIKSSCDLYGYCGPFGSCIKTESPVCSCLKGFVPKSTGEWNKRNWTSGCVRRTALPCEKNTSSKANNDRFLKLSGMKLPDFAESLSYISDNAECQITCLNNCSCTAYAFVTGIGCMVWTGDLIDIQEFAYGGEDFFVRLANSELGNDKLAMKLIISFAVVSCVIAVVVIAYIMCRRRAVRRGRRNEKLEDTGLATSQTQGSEQGIGTERQDPLMYGFDELTVATNNFSQINKLGEGGFGPVYKGKLPNGQEIAVKRLSKSSWQGMEEFKNEIAVISKLQHRNLVRLLGCCIEGEERLLIYECMQNKSLDGFLFDSAKRVQLDWAKRFNIILGIARGLLYLHRDSRLRIIHRDLKVSNILLDENMNPKISDFGLARTFQRTQDLGNTHRVAGTLGYMSPEYAFGGIFSEKSDVFSFGILLLEIVSSKKNTTSYYSEEHGNLLGYAWQLWNEGRWLELVDEAVAKSISPSEAMRCIHVGLLCVQDHPSDRPAMPDVVHMLTSETDHPDPKQPSFTLQIQWTKDLLSRHLESVNQITVSTIFDGR